MSKRLRHVAEIVARWEGLFLFLLLPVVLLPSPTRLPLLLVIPLLWAARRVSGGRFLPSTPLNAPLLLLALMVLVSLYATFDLAFSLPKIAGMVYGLAVFFAVVAACGGRTRGLWAGVGLYLAGGLGVVGLSLIGVQWSSKLPVLERLTRFLPQRLLSIPGRQVGFNPNEVAGVLLWMAPLALVLAVAVSLRRPTVRVPVFGGRRLPAAVLLWPVALVLGGTLLLTQSRAGILGLGAALFFALLVTVAPRHPRPVIALLALLPVGLALVWVAGPQRVLEPLLFQAGLQGGGEALNTLQGRQEIWTRALYGLQDFPFTGMGMNTFRRVVHVLYPLFLIAPDTDIAHAHNHLLQAGLDLGLPGLVAYVAVWLGAAGMVWRSWREGADRWLRALALGLGASLLGYFVYGMVDAVALGARPGFLFWYLLGLVAALYRLTVAPAAQKEASLPMERETE